MILTETTRVALDPVEEHDIVRLFMNDENWLHQDSCSTQYEIFFMEKTYFASYKDSREDVLALNGEDEE